MRQDRAGESLREGHQDGPGDRPVVGIPELYDAVMRRLAAWRETRDAAVLVPVTVDPIAVARMACHDAP